MFYINTHNASTSKLCICRHDLAIGRSEKASTGNDRMFFVSELRVAKRVFLNRAAIVVKALLQFFVSMYIATIHAIRLDTTTRSTGRSSAVSPLSKNAGAMPILADGKSAWTQGGSASSHDSSSPIFTPFLPLSVRPVLFPIPDVTLTRRVKLKADESLSTWETIQIFCNDSRQWFNVANTHRVFSNRGEKRNESRLRKSRSTRRLGNDVRCEWDFLCCIETRRKAYLNTRWMKIRVLE